MLLSNREKIGSSIKIRFFHGRLYHKKQYYGRALYQAVRSMRQKYGRGPDNRNVEQSEKEQAKQ